MTTRTLYASYRRPVRFLWGSARLIRVRRWRANRIFNRRVKQLAYNLKKALRKSTPRNTGRCAKGWKVRISGHGSRRRIRMTNKTVVTDRYGRRYFLASILNGRSWSKHREFVDRAIGRTIGNANLRMPYSGGGGRVRIRRRSR